MALRVCPRTQINIERKVVTIPTAASDSVALRGILPIIAASVNDRIGSEIPAINAGIANLLICFNEMSVLKRLDHKNRTDVHINSGNTCHDFFYWPEGRDFSLIFIT